MIFQQRIVNIKSDTAGAHAPPQQRDAAAAEATGGMKVPVTPRCSPDRRASGTPPADVGGILYNP